MVKFLGSLLALYILVQPFAYSETLYSVHAKKIVPAPLQYDGSLYPVFSIPIKQPENAFLLKEYHAFGSTVKKGETVIEWTSPELLNQLYQANREYIDSKETLHKLKKWESSGPMRQATRDLAHSQHIVAQAEFHLEQTKRLYEAGIVSKQEFNNDKRNYDQSLKNFEQMQYAWEQAKNKGDKLEIKLAKLKYKVAKERYEYLKQQVENLKFISPIDGVVIPSIESDGAEYGVLISPLQWHVIVKVNEWDAVTLKADQKAELIILALNNKKFEGKIEKINMQPIDSVDKTGMPRYEVVISIDSALNEVAESLRLGMTAVVSCHFPPTEGLFIPKQAIGVDTDGPFVNLASIGGNPIKHRVEVGKRLENEVQIIKGIKEGDSLVLFG